MKTLRYVLGLGGWVLAAWLFNQPTAPVDYRVESFASHVSEIMQHEGSPAHVIRWNKGVYARLESGVEVVHVNYGRLTILFDPSKDWCYGETILRPDGVIHENYCPSYGESAGRHVMSFGKLDSTVQDVVLEGRQMAMQKWGI